MLRYITVNAIIFSESVPAYMIIPDVICHFVMFGNKAIVLAVTQMTFHCGVPEVNPSGKNLRVLPPV